MQLPKLWPSFPHFTSYLEALQRHQCRKSLAELGLNTGLPGPSLKPARANDLAGMDTPTLLCSLQKVLATWILVLLVGLTPCGVFLGTERAAGESVSCLEGPGEAAGSAGDSLQTGPGPGLERELTRNPSFSIPVYVVRFLNLWQSTSENRVKWRGFAVPHGFSGLSPWSLGSAALGL